MRISKELKEKLEEEVYDKLFKHNKTIDVSDYKLNLTALVLEVREELVIPIEVE